MFRRFLPTRQNLYLPPRLERFVRKLTYLISWKHQAGCREDGRSKAKREKWVLPPLCEVIPDPAVSVQVEVSKVCTESVIQLFPNGEFENWDTWEKLLPDAEAIYKSHPTSSQSLDVWVQATINLAWYQWRRGNYEGAEKMATNVLNVRQEVSGWDDQETLVCAEVLAGILCSIGNYSEALKLNEKSLPVFESLFGKTHEYTITSMSNKAMVLLHLGKYEQAEKLNREAIERSVSVYDAQTLTSESNLALVLQYKGEYEEAEKLNRHALRGFEKTLGSCHPSTLSSLSNLASVLLLQGRYNESLELNRRSRRGKHEVLGPNHPSALTTRNNLRQCAIYKSCMDRLSGDLAAA